MIPISENLDTVGCFGRCVADAVRGLDAIVGADKRDAITEIPSRVQEIDYPNFLSNKQELNGAVFGLPRERFWDLVPEDLKKVAQDVLDAVQSIGGRIVDTEIPCAYDRIRSDGSWDW